MKEQRIIAFIAVWACLILSSTSKTETLPWFWIALAVIWLINSMNREDILKNLCKKNNRK